MIDKFFGGLVVAVWMIEKKFGSRRCLCLCSHCPQHWYNNTAIQQAVRLGSPLRNFIRGFIFNRRGLRYIGKSSCFFSAIKSTIGATVGCIGYHSFWWDVQDDIMRKG